MSAVRSSIEDLEKDNLDSEFSWIFKGSTLQKSLILLAIYIDA